MFRQLRRSWRRWARRVGRRWSFRRPAASAAGEPDRPVPGPAVRAFLDGETVRQTAYFVGAADPAVIDPSVDWVGSLCDVEAAIRDYILRLEARITEMESQ